MGICKRTRTRVVREGAHVRSLIAEGDGKVGRNEKESGGVVKREGGDEGRKGNQWKYEGGVEDEERENPNRKSIHAVRKEECRENKG